jgi:fluoride exporter
VFYLVYFFVGIGGIVGSLLRYFMSTFASGLWGKGFPFGTLIINLTGSFILGWFTTKYILPKRLHPYIISAFSTGVIGSYTTFSTFCLETVHLVENNEYIKGLLYVLISLLGGLLFVRLGMSVGNRGLLKLRKPV